MVSEVICDEMGSYSIREQIKMKKKPYLLKKYLTRRWRKDATWREEEGAERLWEEFFFALIFGSYLAPMTRILTQVFVCRVYNLLFSIQRSTRSTHRRTSVFCCCSFVEIRKGKPDQNELQHHYNSHIHNKPEHWKHRHIHMKNWVVSSFLLVGTTGAFQHFHSTRRNEGRSSRESFLVSTSKIKSSTQLYYIFSFL